MLVLLGLTSLVMLAVAFDFMSDDDMDESQPGGLDPEGPEDPETPGQLIEGGDDGVWLDGTAGNDTILAGAGADDIRAGAGDDWVHGGDGDDVIYGDWTTTGFGNDTLLGGAGDDLISGEGGDDSIEGGSGNDTLFGGEGDDELDGGTGDDWLHGGPGNDTLRAGPGSDDLEGAEGDDLLIADEDDLFRDWLHGGEGDDTLVGNADDWLEGGPGSDLFQLPAGAAPERPPATIADFDAAEDRIELLLAPDDLSAAVVAIEQQPDGSALIRLNGSPVAHVQTAAGLTPAHVTLAPALPAARPAPG